MKQETVVRTRDLGQHGLTPGRVRGPGWISPWHGVHTSTTDASGTLRHRALAAVLPQDTGFGHLTGAALRGWWLPRLPADVPLLATTTGHLHVRRPGAYVRRSPSTRLEAYGDLTVVSAADTLGELAQDLGLVDLVVALDSALRLGHCTAEQVAERAGRRAGGSRKLRRAIRLADPRSESPWETVLRLLHVASGAADVEVQPVIVDDDGCFVARADLRIVGTRRLPEYDGSAHRERQQHQRDLAREKALARLGLERYGYTSVEIEHDPARIIRDAEDAQGRAHAPQCVRRWHHLASGTRPSQRPAVIAWPYGWRATETHR